MSTALCAGMCIFNLRVIITLCLSTSNSNNDHDFIVFSKSLSKEIANI